MKDATKTCECCLDILHPDEFDEASNTCRGCEAVNKEIEFDLDIDRAYEERYYDGADCYE